MTEHEILLLSVADALGEELLEQVAFVGGATVSLHLDNAQPMDIRSTKDVDLIVSVTSYGDYQRLGEQLRQRGFNEDSQPEDGALSPICRYIWRSRLARICLREYMNERAKSERGLKGFRATTLPACRLPREQQAIESLRVIDQSKPEMSEPAG